MLVQWRTTLIVGAVSLAVGWGMGGGLSSQPPAAQSGRSRDPRPIGVESAQPPAPLTGQLRRKLDQQPARPQSSRNPFVFGSRPPTTAPATRGPAARPEVAPELVDDAPEAAPSPAFVLSGVASSAGPDGAVFTAILSGGQGLLFVKAGDELPGGYVVADVQETMVTIRDGSGGERTLRLR